MTGELHDIHCDLGNVLPDITLQRALDIVEELEESFPTIILVPSGLFNI